MDISSKFKAVTPEDLYNFYGIATLNLDLLEPDEKAICETTLEVLRKTYMEALRTRFAHWHPDGKNAMTIDDMIKTMKDELAEHVKKDSAKMSRMGMGFDMMGMVKSMRGDTESGKSKAEEANTKKFADNLSTFDKDKYPVIAKAVVQLFEARTPSKIILAIDHLNDLQHWGGYILIDFIAGHRDPSNKHGQKIVNEILDIKAKAKTPLEYADKMSSDIRKMVQQSERNRRAGIL